MIGMVMGSGWTKSDDERKCHSGRASIETGNRTYQMAGRRVGFWRMKYSMDNGKLQSKDLTPLMLSTQELGRCA